MIITNVNKTYYNKNQKLVALNNLSVSFYDKGLNFIVGKSGSGKSTLLNLIGALLFPDSGNIIINGHDITKYSDKERDLFRRNEIGFVYQNYDLVDDFSIKDNLLMAAQINNITVSDDEMINILIKCDLIKDKDYSFLNRKIKELSGGQAQRISIARALIKKPSILLADEPTGALDNETGIILFQLLKELSKDILVIVVTHDEIKAKQFGDRIIKLSEGSIIEDSNNCIDFSENTKELSKKGRLSLKYSYLFAIKKIIQNKFKIALSFIISFLVMSVLSFSIVAGMTDKLSVTLRTNYSENSSYVILKNVSNNELYSPFSDKQMEIINNNSTLKKAYRVDSFQQIDYASVIGNLFEKKVANNPLEKYIMDRNMFKYAIELDNEDSLDELDLKIDSRFEDPSLCRFPTLDNEIAITDFIAEMFLRGGYLKDGITTKINKIDEIIGIEIKGFVICGIYETSESLNYWKDNLDSYYSSFSENLNNKLNGWTMAKAYFVKKGFIAANNDFYNTKNGANYLCKLSKYLNEDYRYIKSLESTNNTIIVRSTADAYTSLLDNYIEYVLPIMKYAIILLFIFSLILTSNYITVNMDSMEKELAILRKLGSTKKDVYQIVLIQSFIINSLELILSFILLVISFALINKQIGISLFALSIKSILIIVLSFILYTLLATIIPMIRFNKKYSLQ